MKFRKKAVVVEAKNSACQHSIETLEGTMTCRAGDWLIRGIRGEPYPCKPNIFKETYEPVDAEAATEWLRVYGEEHPPVTEKDNMTDLNRKVQEGMQIALNAVTDPSLKALCLNLLQTWDHIMSQAIIVSVGLSAMRFRTPEQIESQLLKCKQMFEQGAKQSVCVHQGSGMEC